MRAPQPWLAGAERLAERLFRLEHGANCGPPLHVACYGALFALLIVPGAVVAWPARAALWLVTTLLNYSLTIGVMHMHCHRKLFAARAPNRVLELLLCFPSLLTAAEMTVLHVHHHHKHNDGPDDVTSTLGRERGLAALGYWLGYGWTVKWFTVRSIYATDVRRWRKQRFRTTFAIDTLLCGGALAALTAWQPVTMLTCYWIPFAVTHVTIGYFSWLTHAPAGDRHGLDGSVNTVGNVLNLFIFNQGYHAVHHEHPGIHWTDIPDRLAAMTQIAPAYIVPYWVTPNSAWKRWLARRLPPSLERSTYVLAASLVLAAMMLAWQPIDGTVWRLDGAWGRAMTAGYVAGFALVYVAALWLDHFQLLGLRQSWFGVEEPGPDQLTVTGPYRFVRHPLMTGLVMVFWFTPHMTWGQLVLAAGMTGYVVVGTLHDEGALRRRFGDAYNAYARLTPMVIPSLLPVLTRHRARRRPGGPAIVVRRPDIEFSGYGPTVWYADNVVATAMLTAYSALFPALERFMADELRATLPDIRDPELARAVRDFVGQEAMHAHEHARSLDGLAGLGYRVALLERGFAAVTRWILRPLVRHVARPTCAAAGSIAIFAGVEHWTAVMAEATLRQHYPLIYSPIAALYYWHGAEEIEHRSVVADVLAHLGRSYVVRIAMFAFGTLAFGVLSLAGTLVVLAQIPALQGRGVLGWLVYPVRVVWDGIAFCLVREKIAWHIGWGTLRYLVPFHHPDGFTRRRSGAELAIAGLERAVAAGAAPRPLRGADA